MGLVSILFREVYLAMTLVLTVSLCLDQLDQRTITLSVPRYSLAATTVGSLAFFAGGRTNSTWFTQVDIFSFTTNTWNTSNLPTAAATSVGNLALFVGGTNSHNPYLATVSIYNVTSSTWSNATLSEGRQMLSATSVGNTIALFAGGFNATGYSDRVDIYNLTSSNWTIASLIFTTS